MVEYIQLSLDFEEWRPIPGFEGLYEISDRGRIKRLAGTRGCPRGRILKPGRANNGYRSITLYDNHRTQLVSIHRLVMRVFVGECPREQQVNHKNGVRDDNRLENLEYMTPQQNQRHAFDVLGKTVAHGENHGHAKLTEQEIREIRSLIGTMSYRKIGERFGVGPQAIHKISSGIAWKHVK